MVDFCRPRQANLIWTSSARVTTLGSPNFQQSAFWEEFKAGWIEKAHEDSGQEVARSACACERRGTGSRELSWRALLLHKAKQVL